jgi:hypothetical protein
VYTHWGLLNPAPGVVDFDSFRALQPLFDAALTAGIWVILRPGPYINAETTAGGIAHWVTSQTMGTLRTNATDFHDTWQDYIQGIIAQTVPNQITEGGPVIGKLSYFLVLETVVRMLFTCKAIQVGVFRLSCSEIPHSNTSFIR